MSIRATFHYFQGMECDMYSFYRIPKLLFTSEYFKNLSCEAKVLYGLMLDRMSLSIKNRWFDEEDRAYIFFSVEEIMEMLNCGRNKAVNCLKELDQEKGIGLIEKRRIGLGKTNVIYVKNFSLTEYPDEPAIFDSEETPENVAERKENTETEIEEYAKKEPEKPVNTQKFEKQTSGSLKNKLQEVSKTNFKEFEKQTSRSLENKLQSAYPKQSSLYQKLADAFQCQVSYLMNDNETVCLGNDEPSEYSGAKQARQILEQAAALFASGTMTNEDKTIFMDEITRLYLE